MNAPTARRTKKAETPAKPGTRPMHISLRAGERLFLNGAVLRVDRKVTLELLNDATFLLENHVLQVEDTRTPIRQLYFAVQAMLMDPQNADASRALFEAMARDTMTVFTTGRLNEGIEEAFAQVRAERPFHALKTLRSLFSVEAALLGITPEAETRKAAGQAPAQAARRQPSEVVPQPPNAQPVPSYSKVGTHTPPVAYQ